MTQAERVIKALGRGPMTVGDIVVLTGMRSATVARAIFVLVNEKGSLVRLDGGGRHPGRYALAGPQESVPEPGSRHRQAEKDFVAGRHAGKSADELTASLGLSQTAKGKFEEAFRFQTCTPTTSDSSCPKFAEHARHLEALAAVGRFPDMPSRAHSRLPA